MKLRRILEKLWAWIKITWIQIFTVKTIEAPESYFKYINKTWVARDKKKYDVRTFIFPRDLILNKAVRIHDLIGENNDHTVYKIMRWVQDNIKYQHEKMEEWQYPVDTYYYKYGDCEDHAILLASMIINAGIDENRVRVCCGECHYNSGGSFNHAYCIYKRESDNVWVQIDTNVIHKTNRIERRKPFWREKLYEEPWWAFNSKYVTTGEGYDK